MKKHGSMNDFVLTGFRIHTVSSSENFFIFWSNEIFRCPSFTSGKKNDSYHGDILIRNADFELFDLSFTNRWPPVHW